MPVEMYAPCPCGSGKKFKWCCQPFYGQIERAFEQQANGQHDAALRAMDQLTKQFPQNAEVWGKQAELLWENGRVEEAEESVRRALEVNSNYAFGHFLRGMFRHEEREVSGALLLYRKAADLCDPEARDLLAEIYASIGQCELLMNRPLAARAALEISHRLQPGSDTVKNTLDQVFGDKGPLPPLARRNYSFKRIASGASAERQARWERALSANQTGKLSDVVKAFEQLTEEGAQDAAAWYNLGLVRAWNGDNARSIEALDKYVELESNEDEAAGAWALAEVLCFGQGLEQQNDYLESRVTYQILDPDGAGRVLSNEQRLVDVKQGEGGVGAVLLEREFPAPHENLALFEMPRMAAFLVIVGDRLILLNSDEAMLEKARRIIESSLGNAIGPPRFDQKTPSFTQLVSYYLSLRLPAGTDEETAKKLLDQHFSQLFEEQWIHRPLKSLGQIPPIDAVGHAGLRKKVLGLIQFQEDLTGAFLPFPYDFDRPRHKLGLPAAGEPEPGAAATQDLAAMSVAGLAGLKSEDLSDEDLHRAFQAAARLDAGEVAGQFAKTLLDRPARAEQPDRYPLYQHLINLVTNRGDFAEALSLVDAGLKDDCEQNEGRRRNDYELRRAQIHLQAGQPEAAREVFNRLLERTPSNLDVLGRAAEAMLSARLGRPAVEFAEKGLAQAKQKGDQDRTGYFEELLAAARRL